MDGAQNPTRKCLIFGDWCSAETRTARVGLMAYCNPDGKWRFKLKKAPNWSSSQGVFGSPKGTYQHELVHRRRFENAMTTNFAVFLAKIEAAEDPISAHDTVERAVRRFKNSQLLKDAIETLETDSKALVFPAAGPEGRAYYNPLDFYKAKLCSAEPSGWLADIDQRRAAESCDIERTACPETSCP
jgi:hypothetical protein